MNDVSSPRVPPYRITLFCGPVPIEGKNETMECVFNVKKRSWKGGVQIGVVIEQKQIDRVGKTLQFPPWIEEILSQVPHEERAEYAVRAKELLAQQLCYLKLQLAIQRGLRQENQQLEADLFREELEELIPKEDHKIKEQILAELDLANEKEPSSI